MLKYEITFLFYSLCTIIIPKNLFGLYFKRENSHFVVFLANIYYFYKYTLSKDLLKKHTTPHYILHIQCAHPPLRPPVLKERKKIFFEKYAKKKR